MAKNVTEMPQIHKNCLIDAYYTTVYLTNLNYNGVCLIEDIDVGDVHQHYGNLTLTGPPPAAGEVSTSDEAYL